MNVFKDSLTLSAGVALPPLTGNGGPNGVRSGVPGQVYTDEETQIVWICNNQVSRWFPIGTADDVTVIQTNGGANAPDGVVAKGPAVWYGADLSVWLKSNKTLDTGGWVRINRSGEGPAFAAQSGDPLLPHIIIGGVDYGNVSYQMSAGTYNPTTGKTPLSWTFPSTFVDGLNNVPGGASSDCVGGQPRWPAKALFLLRSSSQTTPPYDPLTIQTNDIATQYPTPNIPGWETIKYWPRQFADMLPTSTDDDTALANPINSPTGKWYYCLLMPLGPFCVGPGGSARITWNVVLSSYQQSGGNTYLTSLPATVNSQGFAVSKDASGNVYVGNAFAGTINMGPIVGNLSSTDATHSNGLIAKLDGFGVPQWATTFLGVGQVYIRAICLDASGNIFVGGYFTGTIDFGGGSVTSSYSSDMFLVKLSSTGAHLWDKQFGAQGAGRGVDVITSLKCDASGNIVAGGYCQGSQVDFGGGLRYGSGGFGSVLFKLAAADGSHIWSQLFAAVGDSRVNGLDIDSNGNIFIVGHVQGAVDLSLNSAVLPYPYLATTLVSAGNIDGYMGKFDTNGNYLWSFKFGAYGNDSFTNCAVDSNGNIWACGYFTAAVTLGSFSLNSTTTDILIAKVSTNGTILFARSFTGAYFQTVTNIAVDSSNNVAICGYFEQSLNLGGGARQTNFSQDTSFIAKYNGSGAYLWDVVVAGTGANQPGGVAIDSGNFVFVAGYFNNTATASGQTLTATALFNTYLLKLNP